MGGGGVNVCEGFLLLLLCFVVVCRCFLFVFCLFVSLFVLFVASSFFCALVISMVCCSSYIIMCV